MKLKLIEPKRGLLGRKAPGVEMSLGLGLDPASIAANLGEGLLSVAEEKHSGRDMGFEFHGFTMI